MSDRNGRRRPVQGAASGSTAVEAGTGDGTARVDPYAVIKRMTISEMAEVLNGHPSWRYEHGAWPCRCGGDLVVATDHYARCNGCNRIVTKLRAAALTLWHLELPRRGAA